MSDQRKILLATGIFPPDIGGPATYVKTLAEELPKHGFAVKVVTYADDKDKFQAPSNKSQTSPKHRIPSSKQLVYKVGRKQNILIRYLKYFFAVFRLLKWADIVYAQDGVNSGLPVWLAAKLRGKKYFLKIVGDYAWEQGKNKYGIKELLDDFQIKKHNFKIELWRKIQRMVAKNAQKIIVPSQYLKNIVKKWDVDEEKIRVIYNSVKKINAEAFDKEKIKQELNLTGDIIVSAGRLVPWKGFDTLIEIMPELLKINPNFKLYIIGDGPEFTNYKLQITNLKLEDKIFLTGALKQEVLFKYIQSANMFVLNTGYEGLPHTTIEAMQLGAPVITTFSGGNREVVEDNKNGLLVEYNNKDQLKNAIIKLYKNKDLAGRLAINAKENIQNKFSKEKMIKEVTQVLK